jgi:hypothetical protein
VDPTIIAAIIGAVAAVPVALIGVLSQKRRVSRRRWRIERAKALKVGYILAAIECYLDAQRMGIASTTINTAIAIQTKRARELAESIGISVSSDANELTTNLPLKFDGKAIPIKSAFRIGYIMGRIYFYAISLMATGSLPPIDTDIERLGEAEALLRQMEDVLDQLCASIEHSK